MTDPQKLFEAFRAAKAASQEAIEEVQAAKERLHTASIRERVLEEAVRLHVEEGIDPLQAKLMVEADPSHKFMTHQTINAASISAGSISIGTSMIQAALQQLPPPPSLILKTSSR